MAFKQERVLKTFEIKGKPYEEVLVACKRCGGCGDYSYNKFEKEFNKE